MLHASRVPILLALIGTGAVPQAREGHPLLERLAAHRNGEQAETPSVPGTQLVTLVSGGETRSYRLHVPATLPAGNVPLVISLHGLGSNAAQQEHVSGFSALADQQGFIAAYPEGLDSRWRFMGRTDADVAFISQVIADITRKQPVATHRVMINGISNGAEMSWRMACDKPTLFAAAGFVSGGYPDACLQAKHPPTILFHGTADKVLPYDGRAGQMPVPEFAAAWAGCAKGEKGAARDVTGEATSVEYACAGGTPTVFYTIKDKGHSWPGSEMRTEMTTRDVSASQAMLEFLKAH